MGITIKNNKYNRWQQRNGPNIHDVTSVKYKKETNFLNFG